MKDKCVLVTGATKGIGWAVSRHLADLGCHVVGLARNAQDIDFPGYLYACDLSNAGETEDMLRVIREKYPVDGIVNNVGLVNPQPLGEVDLASLYQVLDLNVRAALQVTQAFVPAMKARHEGRIVNICSRVTHGGINRSSYSAAKSALIGLTRTWALELAPYGVTVNAVSPGPVETELFRVNHPAGSDAERSALASIPMGRFGAPADVAAAVTFLLGDAASYITGQVLGVDGGGSLAGRA
ncbi:SDR family oxidoreductase [Allopusillimonas soli]|uniref:SDR family oxidoreductase n=1 Tax=Allopusillimonas soli TaxID=659016 RepID=A0A853FEG2_9BURK|nr:SDR family oxidoreductase [Allopusillimonas soli]NYT38453.1 SDR family oxidoreductase [Allopusillimonas soli]TEA71992.1 SDR family oxidoreductase [Allopusillimonas soli]